MYMYKVTFFRFQDYGFQLLRRVRFRMNLRIDSLYQTYAIFCNQTVVCQ